MSVIHRSSHHLFEPGIIVGTPGALARLEESHVSPASLLSRHLSGDWGEVDDSDRQENQAALANGWRIMSVYELPGTAEVVWVITEHDRSVTTLLLPEEY